MSALVPRGAVGLSLIVGSGTSGVGAISTIVSGRGSARGGGPTAVVSREDVLASSGIISVTSTNGGASGGSGRLAFSSGSAVTGNTGDVAMGSFGDSRPRREDGLARGKRDKRRGSPITVDAARGSAFGGGVVATSGGSSARSGTQAVRQRGHWDCRIPVRGSGSGSPCTRVDSDDSGTASGGPAVQ